MTRKEMEQKKAEVKARVSGEIFETVMTKLEAEPGNHEATHFRINVYLSKNGEDADFPPTPWLTRSELDSALVSIINIVVGQELIFEEGITFDLGIEGARVKT